MTPRLASHKVPDSRGVHVKPCCDGFNLAALARIFAPNCLHRLFVQLGLVAPSHHRCLPDPIRQGRINGQVSPAPAADDVLYRAMADTKPLGNRRRSLAVGIGLSDRDDLLGRKDGSPVSLTTGRPTAIGFVLSVLQVSASGQVSRITTGRIVTGMQNQMRVWIFTGNQEHCYAGGDQVLRSITTAVPENSVAVARSRRPKPALVRTAAVHLRPKARDIFMGKQWEWIRIGVGHLISSIDRVFSALCGFHPLGAFVYSSAFRGGEVEA